MRPAIGGWLLASGGMQMAEDGWDYAAGRSELLII